MNPRLLSVFFAVAWICLVTLSAIGAPREATTVQHEDTVFNNTNLVTKTDVTVFPAKPIGYTWNIADTSNTNILTITVTRIDTVVDRNVASTNAPVVLTWTNTHTIATITTTNNSGSALFTGAISDTFYTRGQDSITFSNDVCTNGIFTLDWQY
jgi:hypothetical protein